MGQPLHASLLLACASLLLFPLVPVEAAPGKGRSGKASRDPQSRGLQPTPTALQRGTTPYYSWELTRAGQPGLPLTPGTALQQLVALDGRTHYIDATAGLGTSTFDASQPLSVRWASGEAWATQRTRFANLVLVALSANRRDTLQCWTLAPGEELALAGGVRALYAYFPELGGVNDNRGYATLEITRRGSRTQSLRVDARTHALTLTAANAQPVTISPGMRHTIRTAVGSRITPDSRSGRWMPLLVTDTALGREAIFLDESQRIATEFVPTGSTALLTWTGLNAATRPTALLHWEVGIQGTRFIPTAGRWDWEVTPGYQNAFDLQIRDLQRSGQEGLILPFRFREVYAGDSITIQGTLPFSGMRAGALRVFVPRRFNGSRPVMRATLATGSLLITSEARSESRSDGRIRNWEDLIFRELGRSAVLLEGDGEVRQALGNGTPFTLTLELAPYRDGRQGEPFEFYAGLAFGRDLDWTTRRVDDTFDMAGELRAIALNSSGSSNSSSRGGWWQDDEDDDD